MRPVIPLCAIAVLAFASAAIETAGTSWPLVGIAALLAAAIGAACLLAPWHRLAPWTFVLPPLASFAVIALLRQAQGGSRSGYAALAILPTIWVALAIGRRMVFVTAGATAALFGLPILYAGDPLYPTSGWRGTLLWFAVSLLVGLVVSGVVAELKRSALISTSRAAELAETQRTMNAIGDVARGIAAGADPRALICNAALEAGGASLATIVEPTADGSFEVSGSAGIPIDKTRLRESVQPSASLRAYFGRKRIFIPDVSGDAGVSRVVSDATELASVLYEPIMRNDRPVGVLCLGWREHRSEIDDRTSTVASFLAAEAGAAIERADLIAQLDALARTDELTGLPNRRAWDEAIARAVDAEYETRTCIALIDLDHFKAFNDTRGHGAGDELLAAAGKAWSGQLRSGDLLARHGGEEFAVLLHRCTLTEAAHVLERLRAATPRGVTCSVGVIQLSSGESAAKATARADGALYAAKRQGRDRLLAA